MLLPSRSDGSWIDNFEGAAGSPPDPNTWTIEVGGGGWGNNELQVYSHDGVYLNGESQLVLEARRHMEGDGSTWWTSGRITTFGAQSFGEGTVSARIQVPEGNVGMLPAFWMMGDSLYEVGWPAAGEIDILETPFDTHVSHHHVHGANSDLTGKSSVGEGANHPQPLSNGFHVYSVERTADRILMRVDDRVVLDVTRQSAPDDMLWAFDQPFHVLFSLAVGGDWPGDPDERTPDVVRMVIDWVSYEPRR